MRKDDTYKKQKEWAKAKKKIPIESKKRKKDHIRYLDQAKMFEKEMQEKGKFYCYMCGGDFNQNTIDYCINVHHTKGRVGDYYLDKDFWMLAHNKCHLELHNLPIDELRKKPHWDDFLARLKLDYPDAYKKILKQIEKDSELF
jgi:hypothetical protein